MENLGKLGQKESGPAIPERVRRSIPMRIYFVSNMTDAPWGGSEELWNQAARRLSNQGHKVTASVVYWPEMNQKNISLPIDGVALQVRRPEPRPSLPQRVLRKLTGARRKKDVMADLDAARPELVVISHGGYLDGLKWMTHCLQRGISYDAIVQCNHEGCWLPDVDNEEAIAAYKGARRIYCVSKHNLTLLRCQLSEPLPQGEVVWNPFNASREEAPAWPEETTWKLGCVARLDPLAKGQDVLLRVLGLPQWRERKVEVNFYGKGPWEKNLRRLAAYLKVTNANFHGHITDMRDVWATNHLLILPSRVEGLPLSLVEAMLCARPAIVTDVGGNAEACLEGLTGYVAKAPTVELLAGAMEIAWDERERWRTMGEAARTRALSLVPADPVGDLCDKLLSNKTQ
jgi:glycosyltransferase involved in cell wall biosynthesis